MLPNPEHIPSEPWGGGYGAECSFARLASPDLLQNAERTLRGDTGHTSSGDTALTVDVQAPAVKRLHHTKSSKQENANASCMFYVATMAAETHGNGQNIKFRASPDQRPTAQFQGSGDKKGHYKPLTPSCLGSSHQTAAAPRL